MAKFLPTGVDGVTVAENDGYTFKVAGSKYGLYDIGPGIYTQEQFGKALLTDPAIGKALTALAQNSPKDFMQHYAGWLPAATQAAQASLANAYNDSYNHRPSGPGGNYTFGDTKMQPDGTILQLTTKGWMPPSAVTQNFPELQPHGPGTFIEKLGAGTLGAVGNVATNPMGSNLGDYLGALGTLGAFGGAQALAAGAPIGAGGSATGTSLGGSPQYSAMPIGGMANVGPTGLMNGGAIGGVGGIAGVGGVGSTFGAGLGAGTAGAGLGLGSIGASLGTGLGAGSSLGVGTGAAIGAGGAAAGAAPGLIAGATGGAASGLGSLFSGGLGGLLGNVGSSILSDPMRSAAIGAGLGFLGTGLAQGNPSVDLTGIYNGQTTATNKNIQDLLNSQTQQEQAAQQAYNQSRQQGYQSLNDVLSPQNNQQAMSDLVRTQEDQLNRQGLMNGPSGALNEALAQSAARVRQANLPMLAEYQNQTQQGLDQMNMMNLNRALGVQESGVQRNFQLGDMQNNASLYQQLFNAQQQNQQKQSYLQAGGAALGYGLGGNLAGAQAGGKLGSVLGGF